MVDRSTTVPDGSLTGSLMRWQSNGSVNSSSGWVGGRGVEVGKRGGERECVREDDRGCNKVDDCPPSTE